MLRNQRGQALLLVLILTTVIFMIGSAAVAMGTAARKNATLEVWQKKAYYIAEAGIEKALAKLISEMIYYDPDNLPHVPPFSEVYPPNSGSGEVQVEVSDPEIVRDDKGEIKCVYYRITSQGCYPQSPAPGQLYAQKTITAKVKVYPDPFLSYGGPGLKSDKSILLKSPVGWGITSTTGSLLARTGDVTIEVPFGGNKGGIYAGGNVYLPGGISTGNGEIKAMGSVSLGKVIGDWSGEVWAGEEVYGPWWQLGKVTIHKNCGNEIPGFPLPDFPVVDKDSEWYNRLEQDARGQGRYFENAEQFLDTQIQWNEQPPIPIPFPFSLLGVDYFVYFLPWEPPTLKLSGVNVINGALHLNVSSVQEAYNRFKDRYKKLYPNKNVVFFDDVFYTIPRLIDVIKGILGFDPFQPAKLKIIVDSGATIVADSIEINEGLAGFIGIDTSGVNGPFGLFAVGDPEKGEGDVVYKAFLGSGGRLSIISSRRFECETGGNLNLDWVAAKGDVEISAVVNFNKAEARIPPGTPINYPIVSWEIK